MLSQSAYKRESRRLSLAENRFTRARTAAAAVPNPHSKELEGKGRELLEELEKTSARLQAVALEGLELFENEGYPDSWHRWKRLAEDAGRAHARAELELESFS